MSEKRYVLNPAPFVVPTTDGKLIEEHVGGASTGTAAYSLAHMVAPPHWSEPHQTPAFDEITIVVRGRKRFEIDGDVVELQAGQALLIKGGARVRYSNPSTRSASTGRFACRPSAPTPCTAKEE